MKKSSLKDRINTLRKYHQQIIDLGDEEAYEWWIAVGVPDEPTTSEYSYIAQSPSEYEEWRKYQRLVSKYRDYLKSNIKLTADEVAAFMLASGAKIDSKDAAQYAAELINAKFTAIANYKLQQMVKGNEVKSYVEKRYNIL